MKDFLTSKMRNPVQGSEVTDLVQPVRRGEFRVWRQTEPQATYCGDRWQIQRPRIAQLRKAREGLPVNFAEDGAELRTALAGG